MCLPENCRPTVSLLDPDRLKQLHQQLIINLSECMQKVYHSLKTYFLDKTSRWRRPTRSPVRATRIKLPNAQEQRMGARVHLLVRCMLVPSRHSASVSTEPCYSLSPKFHVPWPWWAKQRHIHRYLKENVESKTDLICPLRKKWSDGIFHSVKHN